MTGYGCIKYCFYIGKTAAPTVIVKEPEGPVRYVLKLIGFILRIDYFAHRNPKVHLLLQMCVI